MKSTSSQQKGAEYWTKRISEQEMPALCSTVKTLEKLAKDDVSSLGILGRSVMHDNALTSRILRVANSAIYSKGLSQITTVSRAAVVLGFDTLRNICITAKLLSSLLETQNLSTGVYERLLKLMAQAFQAAMLAKMMLKDHDEELQEEVFIASLLYHLGESAFWSMGGEVAEALNEQIDASEDTITRNNAIREALGTSFSKLTLSIATHWGLGDVLVKSLTNPQQRTPEIRSIFLANKLSEALTDETKSADINKIIKQMAEMLDIKPDELKMRVARCAAATHKLVDAYDARVLNQYLPKNKVLKELTVPEEKSEEPEVEEVRETNVNVQLSKLKQLTGYAVVKTDFNVIVTTTLEGVLEGVGFDRCGIWLVSPCRTKLQPRIVLGDDVDTMKRKFTVELKEQRNLFKQCIDIKQPLWVDEPQNDKWRVQLSDSHRALVSANGFVLAPLLIEEKVIGIYYADRLGSERSITNEDFDSFVHFTQLANVCLSVATRH